jgi:tripeptidyl-peptidase-1
VFSLGTYLPARGPAHQSADVATYLTTLGTTNSGKFNRTGRGFPDVAAQGENFEIAWGEL